jgi:hypothetical protein
MLLNSTYILYLLRAAIISLNKFSFALEQLTITMDGGLNEIICMNLIRLIKRQNESELLEMLNTQILMVRRKKKLEALNEQRISLGLEAEEMDMAKI